MRDRWETILEMSFFTFNMIHELAFACAVALERLDNTVSLRQEAQRRIDDPVFLADILKATEDIPEESFSQDWMIQFVVQNAARIALKPRYPRLQVCMGLQPFAVPEMMETIRLHFQDILHEIEEIQEQWAAMAASNNY